VIELDSSVDPEVGVGDPDVVEEVVESRFGLGVEDPEDEVVEPESDGTVAVDVELEVSEPEEVSVVVEVGSVEGVAVGAVASDVAVVVSETASVATVVASLTVVVTVCVVAEVVDPARVPLVVSPPTSAEATGGMASAPSSTATIAIATEVPLPLSRLRIRDIPSAGRLLAPPYPHWVTGKRKSPKTERRRARPAAADRRRAARRLPGCQRRHGRLARHAL
jgi:hypothetical protein